MASSEGFVFGAHVISHSQVFFKSKLSYAFVNLKPIVTAHVLVAPFRLAKRFTELTPEEVADLFATTQIVCRGLEDAYQAIGLTIAVQDGLAAGQTVEHVHVHVIPRHKDDFVPNDKIYWELDHHDKDANRKARSSSEMEKEAKWFEQFFVKYSSGL